MFRYSTNYQRKIAFLQDGILCRPEYVERGYLTRKVTAQSKIVRRRDVKKKVLDELDAQTALGSTDPTLWIMV